MSATKVYLLLFLLTFMSGFTFSIYIKYQYSLRGKEALQRAVFWTGFWGLISFLRLSGPSFKLKSQFLLSVSVFTVLLTAYYWYRFGKIYTGKSLFPFEEEHKYSLVFIGVVFLICLTNPFHLLVWDSISFNAETGVFNFSSTLLYAAFITVSYVWYLTGIYYIASFTYYAKNTFSTVLIITSILPILIGNAVPYVFSVSIQDTLSFIPVGGFVSLMMAFIAIQRLTVTPIAREKIFEDISLPIFVQNTDGAIVDYNQKFNDLSQKVSSGEKVESFASKIRNHIEFEENKEETEIELFEYNGRYYNSTVTPLKINDRKQGEAIILHDVTDIYEQSQELKRTNYHFRKFSDSAAHEIRNPITVMKGYAEQIEQNTSHDDIREMAEKIQNQSDHINSVTRDFQTAMEVAQTIDEKKYIDIEKTVEQVCRFKDFSNFESFIVSPNGKILAEQKRLSKIFETIFRFIEANTHNFEYTVIVSAYPNGFVLTTSSQYFEEEVTDSFLQHGYTNKHGGEGLSLSVLDILAEVHSWEVNITMEKGNLKFEFTDAEVELDM